MAKFTVTPEQLEELKSGDSTTPMPMEGVNRSGTGTFHNPVTGREIHNQPMDLAQWSRKLAKGWKTGPASPELREKWKIREAELRAENDKMEADYLASHEHEVDTRTRYNEDVKSAVLAVLDQLGVDLPGKSGAEVEAASPAAAPAPEEQQNTEGTQLPLWGSDATPETDTKLIVSEASRPDLHLVEARKEQT